MAKRFTDTEKWNKRWYRELGSSLRDVRQYILDSCTFFGVWEVDLDTVKHFTGQKVTMDGIHTAFQFELVPLDNDKVFIPAFLRFQYGVIKDDCRTHQSVIRELQKIPFPNSMDTLWEHYVKGSLTPMDKDMDKDKDTDKDKDKEDKDKEVQKFDFNSLYEIYPRKQGKLGGFNKLKTIVKTPGRFEDVRLAIERYKEHCQKNAIEPKFIKLFSTFMSEWQDWLDPETGTTEDFSKAAAAAADDARYAFLNKSNPEIAS